MSTILKSEIPEGERGRWRVERFTVTETEARFDALRSGRRSVTAGTYTRLMRGPCVVMSDTPAEMFDHEMAVHHATGNVLINGLGLGMVLAAVLRNPDVQTVTVVEIDPDVIALIGPHFHDARLRIVNASAFDFAPPKGVLYRMIWHDIWDSICGDNIPEMTRLRRKYCKRAYWQGCWAEIECKQARKRWAA